MSPREPELAFEEDNTFLFAALGLLHLAEGLERVLVIDATCQPSGRVEEDPILDAMLGLVRVGRQLRRQTQKWADSAAPTPDQEGPEQARPALREMLR